LQVPVPEKLDAVAESSQTRPGNVERDSNISLVVTPESIGRTTGNRSFWRDIGKKVTGSENVRRSPGSGWAIGIEIVDGATPAVIVRSYRLEINDPYFDCAMADTQPQMQGITKNNGC
jgi:hypothetical protein